MATLASDNFTRADAVTLGSNWTNKNSEWPGIFSNAVDVVNVGTTCLAYWNQFTWPNDQWSQVTAVISSAASTGFAAGVRMSLTTRNGYYGGANFSQFGDDNRHLWKYVGDTLTDLGTDGVAVVANDVLYVEIQGTTLKLFVNGVQKISVTDSSIASGPAGLFVSHGTADIAMLDNWSGGDFSTAASVTNTSPMPFYNTIHIFE